MSFDFVFFRLQRAPDARAWARFAIDQIAAHGHTPALVGGKGSGWRKAPPGREALIEAIAAARNRSVQAGHNPRSRDPVDGWGIYCAHPGEHDAHLCRYREPSSAPANPHDWFIVLAQALAGIADIRYGFGYSGRAPKDVYFGLGMSAGKPSPELAPLFADEEKVARWFRACAWNTDGAYVRDAFPVNVLGRDFLDLEASPSGEALANGLAVFGGLERLTPDLHVWAIMSEELRQAASKFLAQRQLSVVSHSDGSRSQIKPTGH